MKRDVLFSREFGVKRVFADPVEPSIAVLYTFW